MRSARPRILLADDDLDLLELSSAILGKDADVTCASETGEALRLLASHSVARPTEQGFDILITDLNIARPCDGLLLAGAMRYLHPNGHTVLITGYPDFARSLAALQGLLDITLIKPVPVEDLRALVHPDTYPARGDHELGRLNLWKVVDRHKNSIIESWFKSVAHDPELGPLPLTPADRADHLLEILDRVSGQGHGPADSTSAAESHGQTRRAQGYRSEWLALEMSYLRRAIYAAMLEDLLQLDLSKLIQELFELDHQLDMSLLTSLRAFGLGT